jgi:DMSO/TMAO reductase YedYZ molybdopterin-dependent catalytic subunit
MTTTSPERGHEPGVARASRPPVWAGVLTGLLAAAAGLGAGELVAGTSDSLRSPIVSVGDRVVDGVPRPVKEWAISTFGRSDKVVLLGGVAILLALFAGWVGVLALRRSLRAGLIGVGVFTAIGVAASLGRGSEGWASPLPSLVAGAVAAGVVVLLRAPAVRAWGTDREATLELPDDQALTVTRMGMASRRRFLGLAAGVGGAAVVAGGVGRWLQQQAVVAGERLRIVLPRPAEPLPPVPADVSSGVRGAVPFITPNDDFYRIDTALSVPRVSTDGWTLGVTGYVERPLTLTYAELLDRPMVEADITISCVSNEVGGDLIGTARWLGCRLDDLLREAGIQPKADQVVGRSVDGFTAGFPTALLDGRDALVAVAMNGEPLPVEHGFPARLIVPGVYGYVSATKWLSEIQLSRFDELQGYWIPRGWSRLGPIKTESRIDTPRSGDSVRAGTAVPIAGVAWAMDRGITKVEVQVDEGEWREARLSAEHNDTTWRQWMLPWTPTAGRHVIQVRATDGTGVTQTEDVADVAPNGATGWHAIEVEAS